MAANAAITSDRQGLLHNWKYVLATTNPPPGHLDPVSKWLYLTRAGVLPMTLVAAAVAGLLAVYRDANVAWGWFALAAIGHRARAHGQQPHERPVRPRGRHRSRGLPAQPLLAAPGALGRRSRARVSRRARWSSTSICLAIMIVLTVARGWPIIAFALGGFLLSAAYTAPPLRLKKHGLGEPTVLVVWGPLMVGGTYYAATGTIPGAVVLASLPYALLCTTVLMGKHIDKIPWDEPDGTHTLPVILGEARGPRALTQGDVRRVLRVGRRAGDRAGAAGRVAARLAVAARSAPHVECVLANRSRRSRRCRTRSGRCGSRRSRSSSPAGRWPVRARVDRRRHRRLVRRGAGSSGSSDLGLARSARSAFGCTILFSRTVARDGLPPSVALGVRFGVRRASAARPCSRCMRRPLLPPPGSAFARSRSASSSTRSSRRSSTWGSNAARRPPSR